MLSTSKTRATAAYEVIRKHYIKLVEVIVPSDVAGSLYAQTVVNRDVLDRTLRESPGTRSDKAHSLMREVERVIKADAKNFDLFCEILSEEPTTSLSNELRSKTEHKCGGIIVELFCIRSQRNLKQKLATSKVMKKVCLQVN